MDIFLTSIRSRLEEEPSNKVIVVTGNESADLDSIVSAITTSFFWSRQHQHSTRELEQEQETGKEKKKSRKGPIVVPYINIPKTDLSLRSDVEFVLSSNHISSDNIFFRDDLPLLEALQAKGLLSLVLVDHNKIMGTMSALDGGMTQVMGVIDHHADENLYKETANPRRIEVVGSCSSLVTDVFFKKALKASSTLNDEELTAEEFLDEEDMKKKKVPTWVPQVSRLLLGPILIDTMNLNPEMHKVKPLDDVMAKLLFPYTGWKSMDVIYRKIDDARHDTSRLSFFDLLRKDYKEWTVSEYQTRTPVKVGISSVIGLIDKNAKRYSRETMQGSIVEWAKNRTVDISIVLLADDLGEAHGGYQRQMIVDPVSAKFRQGPGPLFTQRLEAISDLQLERTLSIDTEDSDKRGVRVYFQHNNTCTRKQIWPWVEKLLTEAPLPVSGSANL
ncbi:exopolyphosphatase [Entomortierella parvispora]|uniref:Exopolyphosphatase n=1 Tax=Entomortierella parvispora TaxID=205924 RepID=A0A9P3LZH3_9FUNG|nr:exopolyphosphatase [Entomortierella parvispora]